MMEMHVTDKLKNINISPTFMYAEIRKHAHKIFA
jgi:hypothetical protein